MSRRSLVFAVLACVGYSLSDLNIKRFVDHFQFMSVCDRDRAVLTGSMCYVLCGSGRGFLLMPNETQNA